MNERKKKRKSIRRKEGRKGQTRRSGRRKVSVEGRKEEDKNNDKE